MDEMKPEYLDQLRNLEWTETFSLFCFLYGTRYTSYFIYIYIYNGIELTNLAEITWELDREEKVREKYEWHATKERGFIIVILKLRLDGIRNSMKQSQIEV